MVHGRMLNFLIAYQAAQFVPTSELPKFHPSTYIMFKSVVSHPSWPRGFMTGPHSIKRPLKPHGHSILGFAPCRSKPTDTTHLALTHLHQAPCRCRASKVPLMDSLQPLTFPWNHSMVSCPSFNTLDLSKEIFQSWQRLESETGIRVLESIKCRSKHTVQICQSLQC